MCPVTLRAYRAGAYGGKNRSSDELEKMPVPMTAEMVDDSWVPSSSAKDGRAGRHRNVGRRDALCGRAPKAAAAEAYPS